MRSRLHPGHLEPDCSGPAGWCLDLACFDLEKPDLEKSGLEKSGSVRSGRASLHLVTLCLDSPASAAVLCQESMSEDLPRFGHSGFDQERNRRELCCSASYLALLPSSPTTTE